MKPPVHEEEEYDLREASLLRKGRLMNMQFTSYQHEAWKDNIYDKLLSLQR
jgi:hypothetical protein